MTINALVWNENVHERRNPAVAQNYPDGIHGRIAILLSADGGIDAATATLQDPEHGLTEARLAATDVLLWWGHAAHGEVRDDIVERVVRAVWQGMGLIVLHSGHFSKIFKRLLGSPCALHWREAGERERLWVVNPGHPIARGLPRYFELENEEMYGEPFSVPEPLETVFISWFQGGEVFRSGITYQRGAGRIFYFRPGHETYPTYHDQAVGRVLCNAVNWAYNPERHPELLTAPNTPVGDAIETIVERGARLTQHPEPG
jgi:trehalose utilization protein